MNIAQIIKNFGVKKKVALIGKLIGALNPIEFVNRFFN